MSAMMKAAVFVEPGRIELARQTYSWTGPNDAFGAHQHHHDGTDIHILAVNTRWPKG